jgi:ribosomal protein S30
VEIEDKFKKCLKKSKLSNRIKNKLEYNVEIMKEFTKVASAKNVLETTW